MSRRYTPAMMPVLLSSGALRLTAYSVLLNLGLLAGAAITLIGARRAGRAAAATIDVMLAAVVGGAIAARLAYAAIHWAYYRDHVDEVWRIWQGGLSWHGGLLGGALAVSLFVALRLKESPAEWLDLLAPGAAAGSIFGWMACFLSACAYGREVFPGDPLFSIAIDAPDSYGIWAPRLPSQLFGATWAACVFFALRRLGRSASLRAGGRCAAFVVLYFAGSFAIGFSRADASAQPNALSLEHALDLFGLAAGAIGLWFASHRNRTSRAL